MAALKGKHKTRIAALKKSGRPVATGFPTNVAANVAMVLTVFIASNTLKNTLEKRDHHMTNPLLLMPSPFTLLTRLGLLLSSALLLPLPATARPVTATVYDEWYHNRITYCGQTYQHWGVSAAHPWLPCGTPVSVSHQGRTLTVRITDRCDCNSIDLSAGAAHRLGVPLDGIATVNIRY